MDELDNDCLNENDRLKEKIWLNLNRVQNPSRYLGNEWNSVGSHIDVKESGVSIALAFPDIYEVGMSNNGLRILYDIVNSMSIARAERVFTPAPDMEEIIRKENIPLFSLESFRPLNQFDIVGFSLPYELTFTNVLNMLNLASIPFRSKNRLKGPLIIGGGSCAFNAEPVADFFDLLVLGDGEEVLPELLQLYYANQSKFLPGVLTKEEMLLEMASIEGVYVPAFYEPYYHGKYFAGIRILKDGVPAQIRKRTVTNLDDAPYPVKPVVAYRELVHDRAVLEISRGCVRGCRFCQAGSTYRPKRNRSVEKLKELAVSLIHNTGYDELSLASLSSSDYPGIDGLVKELLNVLPPWVNLSLPSLRIDSFSVELAAAVQKNRKSSLTFAPEAATARLRNIINKKISNEVLFQALDSAFKAGWRNLKLYFMTGLPLERDEDIIAIAELVKDITVFFKKNSYGGSLKISVSTTVFIPKPHTPFQWESQDTLEEIKRKQQLLAREMRKARSVNYSWHGYEMGFLEAVFSRGDRRLAAVTEYAWENGARFDNMSEQFSYPKWDDAFRKAGINPCDYANRTIGYGEPLPWDHLCCGVEKDFFEKEHHKALNAETEI